MSGKSSPSASGANAPQEAVRAPRAPVTDRVNSEPAILNGMTVTEAGWIAGLSLVGYVLVAAFVFLVSGFWQTMLILPLFGTGLTLWFASQYLQNVKRGRPDSYYTQAIHLWMADRGIVKPKFLRHEGYWSLGRTLDFSLVSPLNPEPEQPDPAASLASHNNDKHSS